MTDANVISTGIAGEPIAPPAEGLRTAEAGAARLPAPAAAPAAPRPKIDAAAFRAKLAAQEIDAVQRPELIAGNGVRRGVATPLHERARIRLANMIADRVADHLIAVDETRLILGPDTVLEPDIFVFPRRMISPLVRGADVALVIELTTKPAAGSAAAIGPDAAPGGAEGPAGGFLAARAPLYARAGVRELHVVDLAVGEVHVFSEPEAGRYVRAETVGPGAPAASTSCPGVSYTLADILRSI